jgi:hypothetical protein
VISRYWVLRPGKIQIPNRELQRPAVSQRSSGLLRFALVWCGLLRIGVVASGPNRSWFCRTTLVCSGLLRIAKAPRQKPAGKLEPHEREKGTAEVKPRNTRNTPNGNLQRKRKERSSDHKMVQSIVLFGAVWCRLVLFGAVWCRLTWLRPSTGSAYRRTFFLTSPDLT